MAGVLPTHRIVSDRFRPRRLLAALVLLGGTLATGARAQPCGDADGNGIITVSDGVQTLRFAAALSSACTAASCDVDGDGVVTVSDGVNVLRAAADLPATLICQDDLLFETVNDDGAFGELTKIPRSLSEPPAAAAQTVQRIVFEDSFVSGRINTITVQYDVGGALAQADGADLSLIVASALEDGTPSPGFFELPITSANATVTLALDLRADLGPQTIFRLRIANGSGGKPIGQIETIFILIIREAPPRCGNRVLDTGESCDPAGFTCAVGASPGFCNSTCICEAFPGPKPTSVIPPSDCPNDVREPGEQCDGQDDDSCGGQTCRPDCTCNPAPTPQPSLTPPIATRTPTPGPTFPAQRFVDNGDGTVTDNITGLQWEKKTTEDGSGPNLADPHDVDNRYVWSDSGIAMDGPLFTEFLAALNNPPCFAGHCNWRVPTVEKEGNVPELETIVDLNRTGCGQVACIDPIFGPTTIASRYWSSTTVTTNPDNVWSVNFKSGVLSEGFKSNVRAVRAVRGTP